MSRDQKMDPRDLLYRAREGLCFVCGKAPPDLAERVQRGNEAPLGLNICDACLPIFVAEHPEIFEDPSNPRGSKIQDDS